MAAQRFRWEGTVDGEPVVTAAVNWFMGDRDVDPAWTFGPEGERFEVEITGDPSTLVTFHGLHPESIEAGLARNSGIVATALHCVNAIPTCAPPSPACAPTATCRRWRAGPHPACTGPDRPEGRHRWARGRRVRS